MQATGVSATAHTMTFDFGTTSLKAAIVDQHHRILAEANVTYPLIQAQSGWAEQDPALLWEAGGIASRSAIARAGCTPEDIGSVVFVAPWKAVVPVDDTGRVLHNAIIWMDGRATAEAAQLNHDLGEFVGTGQEYWPRLMWLKSHHPEVWDASQWIMGLVTYLKWKASGVVATEASDDFIHSPTAEADTRFQRIVQAAGLQGDVSKFPPSTEPTDIVGHLLPEAAEHLGLVAGVAVLGGFGDLPAITAGAGPVIPGEAHIYFGTSSWFAAVLRPGEHLDSPLTFAIDHTCEAALYPLQTGCLAYDWIVEQVYGAERAHLHDDIQALVNSEVAQVPAGSLKLLATHWLNGELPPLSKNAKGLFLNLTTLHDRRHMVRAVMESICYSHRTSIARYESDSDRTLDAVRVVGGGATSAVWMQMLADVLQRTVIVPEHPRYVGALGARYCSVVASGEAMSLSTVTRPSNRSQHYLPNADNKRIYDTLYGIYTRLHPALTAIFDELNDTHKTEGHPV